MLHISSCRWLWIVAFPLALVALVGCGKASHDSSRAAGVALFVSEPLTAPGRFTAGIEGPAVDADGNLYAVNAQRQHTIGRVTPEGDVNVFVTLPDSSIGNGIRLNSQGHLLVADYTRHNILEVDPARRLIRIFAHEPRMHQPNDIAIGADGRLYASDPNWADSTGQLWRIDPDGRSTRLEANMGTTNGIEVGPDERTLYVNESIQRRIWAYNIAPDGQVSNKRLLVTFADFGLDGMRADAEGNLYVARYGKGTVVKLSPAGEVLREIDLAGENPTNVAFGGPDGRTVYVTVADQGRVEAFRVDVPGRSWQLHRQWAKKAGRSAG